MRGAFLRAPAAAHLGAAVYSRGGFLGQSAPRPTPYKISRALRSRAANIGFVSALASCGGRQGAAPAMRTAGGTSTTAAVFAAALLLSSAPRPVAGGSALFRGWRIGQRKGAHATLSVAASAVTSDPPSALGGVTKAGAGAASGRGSGGAAKPPVVFVLGGPGSGKGTQCERLAEEFG